MDEKRARERLGSQRERAVRERRRVTDEYFSASQTEMTDALSAYDNHPADQAPHTFLREQALGELKQWRDRVKDVDDALGRLERGVWGQCVDCGQPVGAARLEAVPWAARCLECQQRQEHGRIPSHPDAELLSPPFGRTFLDATSDVGVDGEDAWQDVARVGTSNSPQDVPPAVRYSETYVGADENRGSWDLGMHVEESEGDSAGTEHPDAG